MVEAASKRGLSTTVGPVPIVRAAPASPAFLTFAATSRGMVDVNGFPDDLGRHTPSLSTDPPDWPALDGYLYPTPDHSAAPSGM